MIYVVRETRLKRWTRLKQPRQICFYARGIEPSDSIYIELVSPATLPRNIFGTLFSNRNQTNHNFMHITLDVNMYRIIRMVKTMEDKKNANF
jgi:hypothetical protein